MNAKENQKQKRGWHYLLGELLKQAYLLRQIMVLLEEKVMPESPLIDILVLQTAGDVWTNEQMAVLPDGLRTSQASHLMIEFKYTESLTLEMVMKTIGYLIFYQQSHKLSEKEVQLFIVTSKTTQKGFLNRFDYQESDVPGVFESSNLLLKRIPIICLNLLSDSPHNAFFKCFASLKVEKEKAFETIKKSNLTSDSLPLQSFVTGLWNYWFTEKGEDSMIELTPNEVLKMGQMWGELYLKNLPATEVLKHYSPQERLAGLAPQERLAGLAPQERLAGLAPQERLAGLAPQEVAELELYLQQMKSVQKPPLKSARKRSKG